jgi:hypothetical protein
MAYALLPAPPVGFRPAVASDAELIRYGFPPPPPTTQTRLARMWKETFGRDISFTAAQSNGAPHFASRPLQISKFTDNSSPNWSGVVVANAASGPINLGIGAIWNVPTVTSVGIPNQAIGVWIGLDGYETSASGLLQAGIAASFDETGQAFFFAWSEWLSTADPVQPPQTIANLPIRAGDMIETQIWVTSPTTATVLMQNLSIGGSYGFPIVVPLVAPSGVRVVGSSAEWIVERPQAGEGQATLPEYSPVTFSHAAAWSQAEDNASESNLSLRSFALKSGHSVPVSTRAIAMSLDFAPPISLREMLSDTAVVLAGSGQTVTMDEGGVAVSKATIPGKDLVRCEYVGLQPGKITPLI